MEIMEIIVIYSRFHGGKVFCGFNWSYKIVLSRMIRDEFPRL